LSYFATTPTDLLAVIAAVGRNLERLLIDLVQLIESTAIPGWVQWPDAEPGQTDQNQAERKRWENVGILKIGNFPLLHKMLGSGGGQTRVQPG
jgi:hypothetical protein